MRTLKILAIIFVFMAIQSNVNSQISYSDNTISPTALFPSALGKSNTVNGNYALVGGINSNASGEGSFSFGNQATVNTNGSYAVALGFYVESNTPSSFTLGRFLKSNASAAFVIGSGNGSDGYLTNQTGSSLMVGFNSQYPTLFVSNSPGGLKTGTIGIGNITNPTAKLHLLSDDGEAAELKLEHRTTGLRQYAQIYLGTHTIRAGNAENMVFTTPTNKNFAFLNGNMGIGTTEPGARLQISDGDIYIEDINHGIIMKSPNGQCWRGTVTDDGTMQFTPVNCPPVVTGEQTEIAGDERFRIYPNPASHLLNIEIPEGITNAMAVITNIEGRHTSTHRLTGLRTSLDISTLPAGAYMVSILENGSQLAAHQVIVQ